MTRSYLRGLTRRRAVPLLALAALTGGVLISAGGGSPVGAAPKSSQAKPISSKVKSAKLTSRPTPLSQAQKKSPAGAQPEAGAVLPAKGPVAVLLELNTAAPADTYRTSLGRGKAAAKAAARTQSGRLATMQNSVAASVARVAPRSHVIYRMHNIMAGMAVQTDATNVAALKGISGVKAVYPITPKRLGNAGGVPLIGTPAGWTTGDLGQNVTVGVIDSGIDYTHSNFGGPGTTAAFQAIDRTHALPGQFPTAKVIGGQDFVGDDYNADPAGGPPGSPDAFQPIPHPDPNPIDCRKFSPDSTIGHGSHVAGTLAGLGVTSDGHTYTGAYDSTTPFASLKIGPGVAPKASLYALRVFGCQGSTDVVGEALDWAASPNGDDDFSDHLDVVNMSLGSDFGSFQDGDSVASNRLSQVGTVVVASSGNGGDLYDVGGSPANAQRAIAVAASDDGFAVLDALRVTAPTSADFDGSLSVQYDYATKPGVTGQLSVPLSDANKDGCDPFSADDAAKVNGKIAFLFANNFLRCGSVGRTNNAQAAGAIGVLIVSDTDGLEVGINGNPNIPAILVDKSTGDVLAPQLAGGVTVTFGLATQGIRRHLAPQDADKVASFSSRGTRAAGNLKPDVTGVGVAVFSTDAGSGNGGKTLSGTSMSSPMVAGVSALVRSKHPDWTPEEVKADVMNTAAQDIFTGDSHTGDKFAPNRVGAGRVTVPPALDNQVLAYVVNDPGAVSVSFGPVAVTAPTTLTKTVRVVNKGVTAAAYDLSYVPATQIPGVSYSLAADSRTNPAPNKIVLAPRGATTFTVTMTVANPALLTKTIDPTLETEQAGFPRQFLADASGRVVLAATDSDRPALRVPVYSAPRPASTMAAAGQVTLPPGSIVSANVALTGHGVGQGDGTESIDSIVSGYALEASSGQLPTCATLVGQEHCVAFPDERSADVKYLGATTDAPQIQAAGGNPFTDASVYFAVSSWGAWRTPAGFTDFEVPIDLNRDGTPDVQLFTTRFSADSDVFGTVALDLHTGNFREDADHGNFWFLNTLDGTFDTDIFDSDSAVLSVPLSALGITGQSNRRFNYGMETFSAYHGEAVDRVGLTGSADTPRPTLTLDAARPALTAGDGHSSGVMFSDQPNTTLSIRKDVPAYSFDKPQGLLLLHHHNRTGLRAQVLRVKQPSSPRLRLTSTSVRAGTAVNAVVTIAPTAGLPATGAVLVSRVPGVSLVKGNISNGTLTLRLPNFPRGKWTIYAHYIGDNNYFGAYSNSVVLTVT